MTYFKNIGKIAYEGKGSTNPLAFKHYNPKEVVLGKTMEEHLRFAVAYWHTFTGLALTRSVQAQQFADGIALNAWIWRKHA